MHDKDASSNWHWMMQDGLGSVRAEISNSIAVEGSQNFAPYGSSVDALGSFGTYGFTGEPTDVNGLVYDRARYYVPNIGTFASLDPFGGFADEAMSINGYGYVHGNPINLTDPTGEFVTVIGGAAVGFGVGAIAGFGVTAAFLAAAQSGACGCKLQQQVQNMSPLETLGFLGRATLQSAAVGGLLGAIAGLGPLGAVFSGAVTGVLGYDAIQNGLNDIQKNGATPCNVGQTVLGGLGLIGGAATVITNAAGAVQQVRQINNNVQNWWNGTGSNANDPVEAEIPDNGGIVTSAQPKAYANITKFTDYIFKPGAVHGKTTVFTSLGYGIEHSEILVNIYETQGWLKYQQNLYSLGKLDGFGQRINIEIELYGIGNATGKVSYLNSGWMMQPDGGISLNTPFSGFTR